MEILLDSDIAYVAITPVTATFTDAAQSTRLCVRSIFDNLADAATFYWELRGDDGTIYFRDNISISGSDYALWDGTNGYPFNYIASIKGITIVE